MRQAVPGFPCMPRLCSSVIRPLMNASFSWLLVIRQSWFSGKYAEVLPDICSADSTNEHDIGFHYKGNIDTVSPGLRFGVSKFSGSKAKVNFLNTTLAGSSIPTLANGQLVPSYVLGVPSVVRLLTAFIEQKTSPQERKIKPLECKRKYKGQ